VLMVSLFAEELDSREFRVFPGCKQLEIVAECTRDSHDFDSDEI
jgi:hypothetical protein